VTVGLKNQRDGFRCVFGLVLDQRGAAAHRAFRAYSALASGPWFLDVDDEHSPRYGDPRLAQSAVPPVVVRTDSCHCRLVPAWFEEMPRRRSR
jgi:hypothetical protein